MVKRLFWYMVLAVCLVMGLTISVQASDVEEYPYIIEQGAQYYNSSWGFGSGRYGVVKQENIYTDIPCEATINGYSFLNKKGEVIKAMCDPEAKYIIVPEAPEGAKALWLHFSGPIYRNGWVDGRNVLLKEEYKGIYEEFICPQDDLGIGPLLDNEEKTPEQVAKEIDVTMEQGKTAIVLDVSGSMSDNQREVVTQLGRITFEEDSIIEIFADSYAMISYEDLIEWNFYMGGGTDLYQGLNALADTGVENLILISDLQHNGYTSLEKNNGFKQIVVYNPESDYPSDVVSTMEQAFGKSVTVYTIRE